MNKLQFERYKMDVLSRCLIRPIEGAVRPSGNESLKHFLGKARLVWLNKVGGCPTYTEVRFKEATADAMTMTPIGVIIWEVLDTEKETDKSIQKKKRIYERMGFEFMTVKA